jgi:hypothetical protein
VVRNTTKQLKFGLESWCNSRVMANDANGTYGHSNGHPNGYPNGCSNSHSQGDGRECKAFPGDLDKYVPCFSSPKNHLCMIPVLTLVQKQPSASPHGSSRRSQHLYFPTRLALHIERLLGGHYLVQMDAYPW